MGTAPGLESARPLNGSTPVVGTSYLATGLTPGQTYYFTIRGRVPGASSAPSNEVSAIPFAPFIPVGHLIGPVISMASTADGTGYWLATASGRAVGPRLGHRPRLHGRAAPGRADRAGRGRSLG